jgi:hypothetical protein
MILLAATAYFKCTGNRASMGCGSGLESRKPLLDRQQKTKPPKSKKGLNSL